MRVALLSDFFFAPEFYGLSRYASELYTILHSNEPDICPLACAYKRHRKSGSIAEPPRHFTRIGRRRLMAWWQKRAFPPIEWLLPRFDLLHSLELEYPAITYKPWVVTIHDIGPLSHPHFFSIADPERMRWTLDTAVARAARLICVSHTTAQAVQNYLNQDLSEKLCVIHEGVATTFFQATPAAEVTGIVTTLPANTPYFLVTGSVSPRKNLLRVLEAYERVACELPHHLVMTGQMYWDFQPVAEKLANSPYQARIHRVGNVGEAELAALYRGASAHLYLSLMEGFGLPILEAMASGTPVLTSNVSSMPEVAGGAACLVDPDEVEAIAEGMRKIATDEAYRCTLIAKGKARAQQLSWEECARRTVELYRDVLA